MALDMTISLNYDETVDGHLKSLRIPVFGVDVSCWYSVLGFRCQCLLIIQGASVQPLLVALDEYESTSPKRVKWHLTQSS